MTAKVFKGENEITVEDGKFTPTEAGKYILVYTASIGAKTFSYEVELTIIEADLLNPFDYLYNVGWAAYAPEKTIVTENAPSGKGIKLTATQDGTWVRICLPAMDSSRYMSWDDLKEYSKLQLYVYASKGMEVGHALGVSAISAGANVIEFDMQEIIDVRDQAPEQYEASDNGFYFQIKAFSTGDYIILDNFVAIR